MLGIMEYSMRAWANQAHVTNQDVQKLRHFIKVCFPQKLAYGCHPGIILSCLLEARNLFCMEHGSKLEAVEWAPLPTRPPLHKKYGTRRIKPDGQTNERYEPGEDKDQHEQRSHKIDDALPNQRVERLFG